MNSNQQMVAWCSAWTLADGLIICLSCKCSQPVTQADEPFQHEPGCTALGRVDTYPWVALHDNLDRERG